MNTANKNNINAYKFLKQPQSIQMNPNNNVSAISRSLRNKRRRQRQKQKKNSVNQPNTRAQSVGNQPIILEKPLASYLDAVTSPIDHVEPIKIPDGEGANLSISMFDVLVETPCVTQIALSNNTTPGDATGFCFILMSHRGYGLADWIQFNYNDNSVLACEDTYGIAIIPVMNDGYAVVSTLDHTEDFAAGYPITRTQNMADGKIWALSQSIRLGAAGMRILSLTEAVTDTGKQYVTKFYGACVTMHNINDWYTSADMTIIDLMSMSPSFQDYGNSQGVTARLNPFQYREQIDYWTHGEAIDTEIVSNAKWAFPVIYVELSEEVSPVSLNTDNYTWQYNIPLKLTSKFWIESVLELPTPIMMSESLYYPLFHYISKVIARDEKNFPCVVEGHSFGDFYEKFRKFFATSTAVIGRVASIANAIAPLL